MHFIKSSLLQVLVSTNLFYIANLSLIYSLFFCLCIEVGSPQLFYHAFFVLRLSSRSWGTLLVRGVLSLFCLDSFSNVVVAGDVQTAALIRKKMKKKRTGEERVKEKTLEEKSTKTRGAASVSYRG